jgi:hypothetical protein
MSAISIFSGVDERFSNAFMENVCVSHGLVATCGAANFHSQFVSENDDAVIERLIVVQFGQHDFVQPRSVDGITIFVRWCSARNVCREFIEDLLSLAS